jgi:hypothetical protein
MKTTRTTPAKFVYDRRLSYGDWVLLELDRRPDGNAMNALIFVLDRPVEAREIDEVVAHLATVIPRMRQRIVPVPGNLTPPLWADIDGFSVRDHIRFVRRDSTLDLEQLVALATEVYALPLDPDGPLWHATYIAGAPEGRSALVFCIHHVLGDAVMFETIFYEHLGRQTPPEEVPSGGEEKPPFDRFEAVRHRARKLAVGAGSLIAAAAPGGGLAKMLSARTEASGPRPLAGRHTRVRHLAVGEFGPAADWSATAKRRGGSSNALYLAFATRVMARYCERCATPADRLRIAMPLNARADEEEVQEAGNRIEVVVVAVEPDRVTFDDLGYVQERIDDALRPDGAASGYRRMGAILEGLPSSWRTAINWKMWSGLADFGASSVGGRRRVRLGGADVSAVHVMPMTMGLAANFVRLIYDDRVHLSVHVDPGLVRRPDEFDRLFAEELAAVRRAAGTAPEPVRA